MKTLLEIIDEVKDNGKPSYEDLWWAILALDGLHHFDHDALRRCAAKPDKFFNNPEHQFDESFKRNKLAFSRPPKDWVGEAFDPNNPDYQAQRKAFKALADKFLEEGEGRRE